MPSAPRIAPKTHHWKRKNGFAYEISSIFWLIALLRNYFLFLGFHNGCETEWIFSVRDASSTFDSYARI